jgi:hypothetical protein
MSKPSFAKRVGRAAGNNLSGDARRLLRPVAAPWALTRR